MPPWLPEWVGTLPPARLTHWEILRSREFGCWAASRWTDIHFPRQAFGGLELLRKCNHGEGPTLARPAAPDGGEGKGRLLTR